MTERKVNEQLVITYEGPEHEIKKYTTAYTEDQAKYYHTRCVLKHGREANVRVVAGKDLWGP